MRTFTAACIFFSALFLCATALADTAVAQTAGVPTAMIWGLVSALIAQGGTFAIKKLGGMTFFHKPGGTVVLAALAAVLSSVGLSIKNGWNATSILFAAGNGLLSFLVTANGQNQVTVLAMKAKKVGASTGTAAILILAFLGLGAPTCQNFKTCELNALPATLQTVIATVVKIAFDPSKTVDDVGQGVASLSPTQGPCVVAAVSGWLDGQIPSHGQATQEVVAAAGKLHAYLAKHPATACRDLARM